MYNKVLMFLVTGIFVLGINKLSFAMMCGEYGGHKKIAQAQTVAKYKQKRLRNPIESAEEVKREEHEMRMMHEGHHH